MAIDDAAVQRLADACERLLSAVPQQPSSRRQVAHIVLAAALSALMAVIGAALIRDRDITRMTVTLEGHERTLTDHDRRIGAAQTTADLASTKVDKVMADHIDRHHMPTGHR